jgi:hypothetical protein
MSDFEARVRTEGCEEEPLAEALCRWLDGGEDDELAALVVALELAARGGRPARPARSSGAARPANRAAPEA